MKDEFVEGPDGADYVERRVTGSAATKVYRCPGCDQEIPPATPHVVAWPVAYLADRRHWHTGCWERRCSRRPRRVRGRDAPRH